MRTIFSKLNDLYCKPFQLGTAIMEDASGARFVRKYAVSLEAESHLNNMEQGYRKFAGQYGQYRLAPVTKEKDGLVFDYIHGENGTAVLLKTFRENGPASFLEEIKKALDGMPEPDCYFLITPSFTDFFCEIALPEKLLGYSESFFDFTAGNILFHDSQRYFIDYEWFLPFPVPADLLKVHFVECLFENIPELSNGIKRENVYTFLGINHTDAFLLCRNGFLKKVLLNENSMMQISSEFLRSTISIPEQYGESSILHSLKTHQEMVEYQNRLLLEQKQGLAQKDAWIDEQASFLAYKDRVIADREEAIREKDAWSSEQAKLLEYQERVIADREEAIREKDAWIDEQANELSRKADDIERLEEKMEIEHKKRTAIQARLYEIENSKFWRNTAIFHRNLDKNSV